MARSDITERNTDTPETTREGIVSAARDLVIEYGYDGVSTGQVLTRAGISRGGLYHHFSGKHELMSAVLEATERDFSLRLAAAVAEAPDPFAALVTGSQWYLDECLGSRELQQIGLYEGRRALGWSAWNETIAPYGLAMLAAALDAAIEAGQLIEVDTAALAHMIVAVLHEAATIVMNSHEPGVDRERVGNTVASLIQGLHTA